MTHGRSAFTVQRPGLRLDEAILQHLPGTLSRSAVRALILSGAVFVQGRPVRKPTWILGPGHRVHLDLGASGEPAGPSFGPERLLFEDADLLVVDKPPGIPMHANLDPDRPHLVALVEDLLRRRDGEAGYLGIHQRLDLDTSGVVLFSRSQRANPGLARQFEGRTVAKTYLAITPRPEAMPPAEWVESRPLGVPARKGGAVPVTPGGSPAETWFRVRRASSSGLLLEARPRTGRKHQIRVHLAAAGLPILGDTLYGGSARLGGLVAPRPMLHAWKLQLHHPVTGDPFEVAAPLPPDFEGLLLRLALGEA